MKKVANKTTKERSGVRPYTSDGSPSGKMIAVQFLDTGWRVALPILLLSYIGIRIDHQNGTTPLYSLVGFFLSLVMATVLVYKQINSAFPDFLKELNKKGTNK